MNTKYLWLVFPLVLLLVSCQAVNTPLQPTPTKETEDQSSSWEAELLITGGFAGVQRGIKISSTGEVIIHGGNNNLQGQVQLSREDIEKFSRLINEIKEVRVQANPPACADCFQYELNVSINGKHFQATVNDLNLQDSGVAPLINEMENLLAKASP